MGFTERRDIDEKESSSGRRFQQSCTSFEKYENLVVAYLETE